MAVVDLKGRLMPEEKKNEGLRFESLISACRKRLTQTIDHVVIVQAPPYKENQFQEGDNSDSAPELEKFHLQLQDSVARAVIELANDRAATRNVLQQVQNTLLAILTRSDSIFHKQELFATERMIHQHIEQDEI